MFLCEFMSPTIRVGRRPMLRFATSSARTLASFTRIVLFLALFSRCASAKKNRLPVLR